LSTLRTSPRRLETCTQRNRQRDPIFRGRLPGAGRCHIRQALEFFTRSPRESHNRAYSIATPGREKGIQFCAKMGGTNSWRAGRRMSAYCLWRLTHANAIAFVRAKKRLVCACGRLASKTWSVLYRSKRTQTARRLRRPMKARRMSVFLRMRCAHANAFFFDSP
jgi:hypothetical protein